MERYRTVVSRFIALIIDTFVLIPFVAIAFVLGWIDASHTLVSALDILSIFVNLTYTVLMHWKYGQTVGKMVMKLKVVDVLDGPITFRQALLRDFPYIVASLFWSIVVFCLDLSSNGLVFDIARVIEFYSYVLLIMLLVIDVLVSLKHPKRRALHDLIAGTVVVRLDVPETPTDETKLEPPGPEHYDELRVS